MTTLGQQNRGEDGRFVAQPPQDDPALDVQASREIDAIADTQSREKAPAETTPASDPYEVAAKEFGGVTDDTQSDSVVSDQSQDLSAPAKPQPDPKQAGPAQTPPPSPSETDEQKAAAAKAKVTEATKAYVEMSPNTYSLLKSVPGGLVTPDEWAGMDPTERLAHVNEIKELRNAEKRKYNERQQQTANEPVAPTPNKPTQLGPPQPQGAEISGVPADSQAEIDALIDEYGEESPVVKLAVKTARLEAKLAESEQAAQQQAQSAEQQRKARIAEDGVFDQLETQYPSLATPKVRDDLRQVCQDWIRIEYQRDPHSFYDPNGRPNGRAFEIMERTVKRELHSETLERQTERDKKRSAEIRSGSFTRGAPVAPRSNARPPSSDPYQSVAQAMNDAHKEGLSGDAAVDRALKVANGAQR